MATFASTSCKLHKLRTVRKLRYNTRSLTKIACGPGATASLLYLCNLRLHYSALGPSGTFTLLRLARSPCWRRPESIIPGAASGFCDSETESVWRYDNVYRQEASGYHVPDLNPEWVGGRGAQSGKLATYLPRLNVARRKALYNVKFQISLVLKTGIHLLEYYWYLPTCPSPP